MVTRISVNTGNVVTGSVGANDRLNYTVHGDAVNVAARLGSLNKEFGSRVMVSGEIKSLAESKLDSIVDFNAKGELLIRSKSEAVKVYEVISKS